MSVWNENNINVNYVIEREKNIDWVFVMSLAFLFSRYDTKDT